MNQEISPCLSLPSFDKLRKTGEVLREIPVMLSGRQVKSSGQYLQCLSDDRCNAQGNTCDAYRMTTVMVSLSNHLPLVKVGMEGFYK